MALIGSISASGGLVSYSYVDMLADHQQYKFAWLLTMSSFTYTLLMCIYDIQIYTLQMLNIVAVILHTITQHVQGR